MLVTIDQIDVIAVLALDRILPPGEVEEIVEVLNKEIWFRVLHEELPKLMGKEEHRALVTKHELDKDLVSIIEDVEKGWPKIPIEKLALDATRAVKREFIENYLEEVVAKHPTHPRGQELVREFVIELNKSEISTEIIEKLEDEFYRLATS